MSHNSFFLSPTEKYEINNIISSLESNKSIGTNSIPTKIVKPLENDISTQFSDIFKVSFSTYDALPTILKIEKFVPIHKKNNLNYMTIYTVQSHFYPIWKKC